jgi:TetR/AcrR family fatty acid metabolism transcriptional regulator
MGTPGEKRPSEKRERVVEAAVEVFAEHGFHGARIAAIAERAGVAEGTIYLHFRSKDELLLTIFREKMARILAEMAALLGSDADPREKLARYVEGHLGLVTEQPALMQVLTVEVRQSARFMRSAPSAFGRYLALLGHAIAEGQARGIFRADLRPSIAARAIFGAVDELARAWVLQGGTTPEKRAVARHTVLTLVLDGLLGRGVDRP